MCSTRTIICTELLLIFVPTKLEMRGRHAASRTSAIMNCSKTQHYSICHWKGRRLSRLPEMMGGGDNYHALLGEVCCCGACWARNNRILGFSSAS
mmetsp:Transcript_16757/g.38546  ORF Transcript_16757/g.38546 Transcript_16757/m.38546 type:complete len:95 (+) Transcript_16757:77-361(+)